MFYKMRVYIIKEGLSFSGVKGIWGTFEVNYFPSMVSVYGISESIYTTEDNIFYLK